MVVQVNMTVIVYRANDYFTVYYAHIHLIQTLLRSQYGQILRQRPSGCIGKHDRITVPDNITAHDCISSKVLSVH